ncbi:MAG: hypothetical protein NTU69_08145 [Proteobacteria bacterium]|nr:hypothetical protein [Pseudomonadota bacterium]
MEIRDNKMLSPKTCEIVQLTDRQLRSISCILNAKSIEDGCKQADVPKTTFYGWLQDPNYKDELTRQRNEVIQEGLSNLKTSIRKAVEVLMECLNSKDESVKRRAANDLLTHCLRLREIEEVEDRLQALEEIIIRRKVYK